MTTTSTICSCQRQMNQLRSTWHLKYRDSESMLQLNCMLAKDGWILSLKVIYVGCLRLYIHLWCRLMRARLSLARDLVDKANVSAEYKISCLTIYLICVCSNLCNEWQHAEEFTWRYEQCERTQFKSQLGQFHPKSAFRGPSNSKL